MKRLILTILVFFAVAAGAKAQSTTVSGTVTDSGGQTWNNGTFTFTFVPNPQYQNSTYTWSGGTLNQTISGTLSGTGTYSVSIPSNSTISPIGSTWQLQVCPNATFPCSTSANTVITGATQTLNATPPDISINLSSSPVPTLAYADDEISTAPLGGQYFNTTSNTNRVCTVVSGSSCTTWGAAGGGLTPVSSLPATCTPGTTSPVQLSIYPFGIAVCNATNTWSMLDPTAVSPFSYGAKWDVKFSGNCSATNTSNVVNCTGGDISFTAADIGKIFFMTAGTTQINQNQLNNAIIIAQTTITGVNSSTQITVGANASASCTPGVAAACTIAYGSQDDATAINNAVTAAFNAPNAKCALELPAGAAFFGSPILNGNTTNQCMGSSPNSGVLADTTSTGPVVYGKAPGSTVLIPLPSFNLASCTNGSGGSSCNGTIPNLHIHDFSVNGLQQPIGGTHAVTLWEIVGGSGGGICDGGVAAWNVAFSNWGLTAATSTGLGFGNNMCNDSALWNVNSSSFGAIPCAWNGSGNIIDVRAMLCFGASSYVFALRGSSTAILNTTGSQFLTTMNANTATIACGGSSGQTWNSTGDLFAPGANSSGLTVTSVAICNSGSANMNFDRATMSVPSTTTGTSQIFFLSGTNIIHMRNSTVTATGTNNRVLVTSATDKFFDDGSNVITNGTVANSIAANTVFGTGSANGSPCVIANVGLTSGWGTSTVTSASGDSHRCIFVISVTGVPAASPVLTFTYPKAYPLIAPATCSILEVSGTFGIITNPSVATPTTSSVAITFTGTPVATNTYTLDLSCGP